MYLCSCNLKSDSRHRQLNPLPQSFCLKNVLAFPRQFSMEFKIHIEVELFLMGLSVLLWIILEICTGSTNRNWHKVKTWLDQMFWKIYQKLMVSGFLSSGHLCLIHHLKLFWPHVASTARQKGCHILVKMWIFDDPFHKKLPVMVILVPSDDKTFRIRKFFEKIGL